ncbi:MAG: hypothetical protein AB7P08_18670 [Burkholderiales bacterium]
MAKGLTLQEQGRLFVVLQSLTSLQDQQANAIIALMAALLGSLIRRGSLRPAEFDELLQEAGKRFYEGADPPPHYRHLVESISDFARNASAPRPD